MNAARSALAIAALAFVGSAQAALPLANEYSVSSTATNISGNQWQFDYTITNNTQGAVGQRLGFDGFSILIPETAVLVSQVSPQPFVGAAYAPGYWQFSSGNTILDLGGDHSQNFAAPSGNKLATWWGQYEESVYQLGSTISFSITLDNVSAGINTAGLVTYWAHTSPTATEFANNQYGNYTTYLAQVSSPVAAAVPEPESYAMLLAGLGLLGLLTRKKAHK